MTRFVDVHVHPPLSSLAAGGDTPLSVAPRVDGAPESVAALADYYRSRDGIAVVHAFDAVTTTGVRALPNERVAEMVSEHPDVLVGLGSVDPHRGAAAVTDLADAKRLGLRGLYFHPPAQRFDPSGRLAAPLWEMAADLELPVVVHSGTTSLGAGRPGGEGVRLAWGDPMNFDTVAAAHPDLQIVMVHPTPPWEEHALAVTRHKANVFLALSGRRPDRMGTPLRTATSGPGAERLMCGTGFPLMDVDEWLAGWDALEAPNGISRRALVGNAAALFGLAL